MEAEVKEFRRARRATKGTQVIHLTGGDTIASLTRITAENLKEEKPGPEKRQNRSAGILARVNGC